MTIRNLVGALGLALALASPSWAQTTTTTTTTTGSFDALSPGNQKIANALFAAQHTTGTTLTPLTKNQIADLKGTEGWGKVFKQMKADGLVSAKNLGQVVSGYQHQLHAGTATATARTRHSATTHGAGMRTAAGGRGPGGSHPSGGVAVSSMGGGGFGHGMGSGFAGGMGGMGGMGHGGGHGR